jgi:hypothetical protein
LLWDLHTACNIDTFTLFEKWKFTRIILYWMLHNTHFRDVGIDGRIILKWMLEKWLVATLTHYLQHLKWKLRSRDKNNPLFSLSYTTFGRFWNRW